MYKETMETKFACTIFRSLNPIKKKAAKNDIILKFDVEYFFLIKIITVYATGYSARCAKFIAWINKKYNVGRF